MSVKSCFCVIAKPSKTPYLRGFPAFGAAFCLLITNALLYQLSYTSILTCLEPEL